MLNIFSVHISSLKNFQISGIQKIDITGFPESCIRCIIKNAGEIHLTLHMGVRDRTVPHMSSVSLPVGTTSETIQEKVVNELGLEKRKDTNRRLLMSGCSEASNVSYTVFCDDVRANCQLSPLFPT